MAFHVGQKVVCVDVTGLAPGPWKYPKKGGIYTVDGYGPHWSGRCGVILREIQNNFDGVMQPFKPHRFRPLINKSTETGMAILREILDRESIEDRKPVRAPATSRRLPCPQSQLT